jgi:hypothetical protein
VAVAKIAHQSNVILKANLRPIIYNISNVRELFGYTNNKLTSAPKPQNNAPNSRPIPTAMVWALLTIG